MNAAPTANSGAAFEKTSALNPDIRPLAEFDDAFSPHKVYFQQLFQSPPVICGLQMKPLSIGRYRLMSRFSVAFVSEKETIAQAGDLLKGILICSKSVADFIEFNSATNFKHQVEKFGRRFGFFEPKFFEWSFNPKIFLTGMANWSHRKLWPKEYDADDLAYLTGEMKKFQDYIVEGSVAPDFWDESVNNQSSAAHWSHNIEVALRGNLGATELEINENPLGKMLWDFYKFMENQGLVQLISAEEMAEINKDKSPEQVAKENEYAQAALAMLTTARGGQNGR